MKFEIVKKQLRTAFSAWRDGNTHVDVDPPPAGDNPRPFIVGFTSEHYMAGHVIVFAQSAEHAVERVETALLECASIQAPYRASEGGRRHGPGPGDPLRIIEGVASGKLKVTVSEHDLDCVLLAKPWAANDGLCY